MSTDTETSELKEAVKKAIKDEFEVTSWGKPAGAIRFSVVCPSGQKVLLRRLDPLNMMAAGLLDEVDFFSKKLFPESLDKAGNPIESKEDNKGLIDLLKDPEKRDQFIDLLDRLCVAAVVKPRLYIPIINDDGEDVSDLKGKAIPVTNLDFSDKMFVFGEANKPLEEISSFRVEPTDSMATLSTGPSL
jgi:hypothetical protein